MIPRREFITLLGGAAAWPLGARAQQPERMSRVGVLVNVSENDPDGQDVVAAFVRELQRLGWSGGRNVRIDTRWGAGDRERYRSLAAELVGLMPDVVLAATDSRRRHRDLVIPEAGDAILRRLVESDLGAREQANRGRRAAEQRDEVASGHSITSSARASNFQSGRFVGSQWFPDRATSAQTNSRAPSVVLNQIDDLWSPSTFHLARDRRSSCRIRACNLVAHAKPRLSCGAHPR